MGQEGVDALTAAINHVSEVILRLIADAADATGTGLKQLARGQGLRCCRSLVHSG
jgi:hypothetical protein